MHPLTGKFINSVLRFFRDTSFIQAIWNTSVIFTDSRIDTFSAFFCLTSFRAEICAALPSQET